MKIGILEFNEFKKLADRGVFLVENLTKYENQNRDIAALAFFGFSMALLPLFVLLYWLLTKPFNPIALILFILMSSLETWFFKYGWDFYTLHKDPLAFFWPYFKKKYVKLVLLGTQEINGKEYVSHHFITDNRYIMRKRAIYVRVSIRKDIHEKAMELNQKLHSIAVDKNGEKKVVFNDGALKDSDEDVILVAAFIKTLYTLYGDDIKSLSSE